MRVQITLDVHEESADPDDRSGVTEEAYEAIIDFLIGYGDNVVITKGISR